MAWKRELVGSLLLAAPLFAAGGCATKGEGSETHFIECKHDADCAETAWCERGHCAVRSGDAAVGTSRSALWATRVADTATPYDVAVSGMGDIMVVFSTDGLPASWALLAFDADGNASSGGFSVDNSWVDRIATGDDDTIYAAGRSIGSGGPADGGLAPVNTEAYLLKFRKDALNFLVWDRQFGDKRSSFAVDQRANAVAVDHAGNVIVAGEFNGRMTVEAAVLRSAGGRDAFILKLDPDGNLLWSRTFGDAAEQAIYDITVDAENNVLLAATFGGVVNLGGDDLVSSDDSDALVAKLTADGDHVWSQRIVSDGALRLRASANGSVTVLGRGTPTFGNGPPAPSVDESYLAHFDQAGQYVSSVGLGAFSASDLDVDSRSNSIVAGRTLLSGTQGHGGEPMIYRPAIRKFASFTGSMSDVAFGEGNENDAHAVAVGPDGAVVVTGAFKGQIDVTGTVLNGPDVKTVFLAKLAPSVSR
jgi:hypothetical protein